MNPTPEILSLASLAGLVTPAALAANLDAANSPFVSFSLIGIGDILALLAIGAVSVLLGPRARWGFPIMVLALRSFGIVLGAHGAVAPLSDLFVTPILCFVLLILANVRLSVAIAGTLAGAFGLFHGLTDGLHLVATKLGERSLAEYGVMTIVALLAGAAIGEWIHHHEAAWASQVRRSVTRLHGFHLHG